jgi:hypothetical protein
VEEAVKSLDECLQPSFDALREVQEIGRERAMRRDVDIEMRGLVEEAGRGIFPDSETVFDSGWYCPIPGKSLPPIESFKIPVNLRGAK